MLSFCLNAGHGAFPSPLVPMRWKTKYLYDLDEGLTEEDKGSWLLSFNQLWTLPLPWQAFLLLISSNIGQEALGTEVPLSILFLGPHIWNCFELSRIRSGIPLSDHCDALGNCVILRTEAHLLGC